MNTTRRDLKWSILGYAVYMLSQMSIILVMARLSSPDDLGRYGLAISVCSIVILFFNLGLRSSHATDISSVNRMGTYVSTRILSTFVGFLIICGLSAALFRSDPQTMHVIWLVAYSKSIETFSDLFYGSFQKFRKINLMAASLSIRGPIAAIAFAVLLWISGDILVSLLAQAIVWTLVAAFFDARKANELESCFPRFNSTEILRLVKEALPLGVANFFTEIGTSAPRIVVTKFLGLGATGVFTAVGYVLVLGTVFASSVSHAISNRLAREFWSEGNGRFSEITKKVSGAMFMMGLVAFGICFFWAEDLLYYTFGDPYAAYGNLLTLFTATLSLRMPIAVLQTALIAQRRFYEFAILRFVVALAIIFLTAVGAIQGGIVGVSIALLLVSAGQLFCLVLLILQPQNRRNSQT